MLDFLSHSLIKSLFKTWITSLICLSPILYIKGKMEKPALQYVLQSNLAIRNSLIRNKLVLRNHFLWPICHLLHKDKELLASRNNFRATKKFLFAKFDCNILLFVKNSDYFWLFQGNIMVKSELWKEFRWEYQLTFQFVALEDLPEYNGEQDSYLCTLLIVFHMEE